MKLVLVDSLSLPGSPEKANDDAFGVRERACAVLDGATGLGENLMPGPSDAAWLARFGANRIMSYIGDGASAQEAVTAALFDAETSFTQLRRREPEERYEIPCASLMLAVAEGSGVDFLWYGDCAALVRHADGRLELVGEAMERRAGEAGHAKRLAEGQGIAAAAANARDIFLPALRMGRNRFNTPGGGYLFAPEVIAADHAHVKRLAVAPGAHLLLMTDGFLALASDYGRYTLETLIDAAVTRGLPTLGQELRAVEEADPDGRKFPRFKKSDDATAVLVKAA